MGRVQNKPAQPAPQASKPQPPVVHHVEEVKPIPAVEQPLAVHNLTETVVNPIPPQPPSVIEIEFDTPPSVILIPLPPSLPDIIIPPLSLPQVISLPPLIFGTPDLSADIGIPSVIVIDPPLPAPSLKVPDPKAPPALKIEYKPEPVKVPVEEECKPILPVPPKPVKPEPKCLGRKLAAGEVVDGDTLPPSEKKWNPAPENKVVRWFDMQWKSDGVYELVNWCVFMTHMELELRRL